MKGWLWGRGGIHNEVFGGHCSCADRASTQCDEYLWFIPYYMIANRNIVCVIDCMPDGDMGI